MSGSSIGAVVGGVIGAVLAPFTAGASLMLMVSLGMTIGGMVGGMLDPPRGPDIKGPRVNDLAQQTSTYGAPIPRLYGTIAVFGNIFWIENNKLKEVAQTSTQGGKGGAPEGSSTTYKYYGTFALGLCKGPIVGVRRIWIGGKLWYNKGITHENTMVVNATREKKFKLFLGTEDQMPAARMEADVGVANCPAYRGLAYILFHDLDLTAYGNSIATLQIKVEVVVQGDKTYTTNLKQSLSIPFTSTRAIAYQNYLYVSQSGGNSLIVFDVSVPSDMKQKSTITVAGGPNFMFIKGNRLYISCGSPASIRVFKLDDPSFPQEILNITVSATPLHLWVDDNYIYVVGTTNNVLQIVSFTGEIISTTTLPNQAMGLAVKDDFAYVTINGGVNELVVYNISDPRSVSVASQVATTSGGPRMPIFVGNYIYCPANTVFKIFDITNPNAATLANTLAIPPSRLPYLVVQADDHNAYFLSGVNIDVWDINNPLNPVYTYSSSDSIVNFPQWLVVDNAVVYLVNGNTSGNGALRSFRVFDTIATTQPLLGSIVSSETLQSKLLTASDIDTSLLTQQVRGYRISNTAAIRGGLEPLQGSWPFDAIQDGYKIKFVPRGLASVATIPSDKLDARSGGDTPGIKITKSREMDLILPAKVSIQHIDHLRGYDTGEQYAPRLNTDAVNTILMEMPIVLTPSEAKQKCQTLLYLYWLERYDISFKLPPEYLHLQPTDVVTITAPGETYNVRLTQIAYTTDGRLECQGKFNQPSIYTPTYSQQDGHEENEELDNPGFSVFVPLDIPLLIDVQNTSGFTAAVTGSTDTWQGATISRSDDGGQSFLPIQGVTPPGSIVGVANNTIDIHDGFLIDKARILNVELYTGSLSSVTELQMLNGQNHFAYGLNGRWEIIAAQNCVLQGDGTYKFTDLLRGRFGTEIYTGTHAVNDWVVYLDSARLNFLLMNTNTINAARTYAAISSGDTIENSSVQNFTYKGVNLEPLNPVYLNGNRDVSGNWTLTWIRRTRIGGEWRDLVDATLGETTESYVIEIYSSNLFTVLRRTLTATTQTVSYTSANQVTDFGSNQATLNVRVYQVSDIVGTGYPLQASITR